MVQYLLRLIIAGILGFILGLTNNMEDRTQSGRVFAIICMGAALITIAGLGIYKSMDITWVGDPARLPAQVISALGFLGTGMIWVTQDKRVLGVNGAAALWLTAILGMLIGAGLNDICILGAIFFVLIYKLSPLIKSSTKEKI